jgi:CubicO group peptidase (beta-lactamase class C family)
MRRRDVVLVAALLVAGAAATDAAPAAPSSAAASRALAGFDRFVEQQCALWQVPGVSIVIVHEDRVLLAQGYGLRDVEAQLPMTADTVQPIASITKSFTAAALATLVRDGVTGWDTPVRELAPDFRLSDESVAARVTLRDMLSHRTGLSRNDRAWFGSPFTREVLYQRLRYFSFDAGLRERFGYNNLMYMAAGHIGGRARGVRWEELVHRALFTPLGMAQASTDLAALRAAPDHATGYSLDDQLQRRREPYQALDAMAPTGAINAGARDMGRYLRMLLAGGSFDGRPVVAPGDLAVMTSAQIVLPDARRHPELGPAHYGLGWFVSSYRGERMVEHGGDLPGVSTLLAFLPQAKIGVYVAANLSGSALPQVLTYAVFDRLLGLAPVDWSTRLKRDRDALRAAAIAGRAPAHTPRRPDTRPAHALADYAGEYEHGGYGLVSVEHNESGALRATYNGFNGVLEHFHFDVFQVLPNPTDVLGGLKFQFLTDVEGDVAGLRVALDLSAPPIEFVRRPDRALRDPEVLRRFVGEYRLGESRLIVALRPDHALTLASGGQVPVELRPLRGTRFAIATRPGQIVRFVADGDGPATSLSLALPGATLVAPRVDATARQPGLVR